MGDYRGKVISGGRIVVPAEIRRALQLVEGDTVYLRLDGGELRVRSAKSALRDIQDRLRPYAPASWLVSDELIMERRAEAARE